MNRILGLTLVLVLAAGLGACSSKPAAPAASQTSDTVAPSSGSTAAAGGADTGEGHALGGAAQGGEAALLAKTTIYFDYDSSEIRADQAPIVAAHGKRLAGDRTLKVRLEGHTDERGSAEYNVALGERRAQAVKRALLLQGVSEAQLTTVSYGEERPAVEGHDEAAWSQNRRVEIAYQGGR
ncbi:MAG: peptidoglycan-associated lipoprotein Pal [Proteobacteria bacterium]|nr:peptidoglycan-associated lipoprotein Pal [Pseudomonadota bacterium]